MAKPKKRPGLMKEMDLDHKYLHFRRTKIVASIGPASASVARLRQLIKGGMNVARINFSHGDAADHVKTIARVRQVARQLKTSVAILGDLCGPKVRVGTFVNDRVLLRDRSTVTITTKNVTGKPGLIPSQYKGLVKEARIGERILLDDGNLEVKVLKKTKDSLQAKVVRGGVLKNKKGMNLPDTDMKISALTAKDKSDARYCIKADVDYLALSFVRFPQDIRDLKKHLKKHGADIPIIAKIEKPEALENISDIISLADGIMVARGDLGVELPAQKVPLIQNKLIELANELNKPVIVATQMMESMIDHSRPTRAEVTDVAGACLAGADAVMLSAETAAGKYPVESLVMMDTVLRETEMYQFFNLGGKFRKAGMEKKTNVQDILGIATAQLSRDLMVRSVFVQTRSGYTARMISADRPAAPIIAVTPSEKVRRRLNLLWGVNPYLAPRELAYKPYLAFSEGLIKKLKLGKRGEFVLLLTGFGGYNKATNSIIVHQIP